MTKTIRAESLACPKCRTFIKPGHKAECNRCSAAPAGTTVAWPERWYEDCGELLALVRHVLKCHPDCDRETVLTLIDHPDRWNAEYENFKSCNNAFPVESGMVKCEGCGVYEYPDDLNDSGYCAECGDGRICGACSGTGSRSVEGRVACDACGGKGEVNA